MYVPSATWVDKDTCKENEVKFGLLTSDLKQYYTRGQATAISQFYNLIVPGLILARHIFEGLERPLFCDNDENGDCNKRVYTWRPRYDYGYNSKTRKELRRLAPEGKVFTVIVTPNKKHAEKYPDIKAWIDRWNWVDEDEELNEAPQNWVDRYTTKVWTRV